MIIKTLFLLFPTLLFLVPLVGYKSNKPFMQKFYLRMTFSYHCRKLYTLVVLMWLILFHYVAHEAMPGEYGIMVSSILMLAFFRFKCADRILHLLHDNRKYSYILVVSTLITMFIPHLYTLAATTGTVLLAAVFYPSSEILRMAQMVNDGLRLSKNTDIVVEYYY